VAEPPCPHTDPEPLADSPRRCRCGRWGYITTNRLLVDGVPVGLSIPGCRDNLPIRLITDRGERLG